MKTKKRPAQPRLYLYNLKIIDNSFLTWVKPMVKNHPDFWSYAVIKLAAAIGGLAILLNIILSPFLPVIVFPNKTTEFAFLLLGIFGIILSGSIRLPLSNRVTPAWKKQLLEARESYNRSVKHWNELFPKLWVTAVEDRGIAEFNRRYWQLSHFPRRLFDLEEKAKISLLTEDDLNGLYQERVELETYFPRL